MDTLNTITNILIPTLTVVALVLLVISLRILKHARMIVGKTNRSIIEQKRINADLALENAQQHQTIDMLSNKVRALSK